MKPRGALDTALITSAVPASVAAAFTRNRVVAAPVVVAREHARDGRARAVIINSGIANACTGGAGLDTARATCAELARSLDIDPAEVLPCSTGKIGVALPRARLLSAVRRASLALAPGAFWRAARAITTTDAFVKADKREIVIDRRRVTVAAMAKGAGMIAPDMATLLVFAMTDARVSARALRPALRAALSGSFNAITVDGDTSTNDTTIVLANGRAGNSPLRAGSIAHKRFTDTLSDLLGDLARLVVLDGEGATRAVEVVVRGARSARDAKRVARSIAGSTLTKAAFHGGDPNWGRILCAAGYAGVPLEVRLCRLWIGGVELVRHGISSGAEARAARAMRGREFGVVLDLGQGSGAARVLTSDLSPRYVRFNSAYST